MGGRDAGAKKIKDVSDRRTTQRRWQPSDGTELRLEIATSGAFLGSRILTSRFIWGAVGLIAGGLSGLAWGVGATWLGRAIATRGLAGRIATGEKELLESEIRLLSRIARDLDQPAVSTKPVPDKAEKALDEPNETLLGLGTARSSATP